jgi:indole-3-glycerol phosphate synthase
MNFIETIIACKKEELDTRKKSVMRVALEDMPKFNYPRRSLQKALSGRHLAVIAEAKHGGSSQNGGHGSMDLVTAARKCVEGGASALAVQTDEKFFRGNLQDIGRIRDFMEVPILRKDVIVDSYQIYEAKAHGADAVLLMAAALDPFHLKDLVAESRELGMDALVEVRHENDLDSLDVSLAGMVVINNRDLMTLEADIGTSFRLRKFIPPNVTVISEGDIRDAGDLRTLVHHGIHAVILGEGLLNTGDPAVTLAALMSDVESPAAHN